MEVLISYSVYKVKNLIGSEDHKILEPVWLGGEITFATEHEAMNKLIECEKTYEEFTILKKVFITT